MQNHFRKYTLLTLLLFLLANFSVAQDKKFPTPREENLLNGLKVLIWSQPNTKRVTVKLRVHSGSAFDPKDREGTIALLSEILFPDAAIKDYFEEDLEGKLEVIYTHDYIQIDASAKSDEFLAVLETLAPAIADPQIDKKTFEKVKDKHLEKLKELENDPNYIADQAIAERLYGDFPYGRANYGTTESIKTLDFADLSFAKQRFLTADNATLTITGDVKSNYAYKAARRLFGGWQKSLRVIPANFRLPEDPDITPLTINIDEPNIWYNRYAMDFVSRRDKDFYASELLKEILNERYIKQSQQEGLIKAGVNNHANFLRGYIVFVNDHAIDKLPVVKEKVSPEDVNQDRYIKDNHIKDLFTEKISQKEFDSAKTKVLANLNNSNPEDIWLEIHTYKLDSIESEIKKIKNTTVEDVQTVAIKVSNNKVVEISIQSVEKDDPKNITEKIPDEIIEQDPKDPLK